MNEKELGAFYTPVELVEYMVSYAQDRHVNKRVLEPSAGDGRFVKKLLSEGMSVTSVELDVEKCSKLEAAYGHACSVFQGDFITFSLSHEEKYDLIIGNPPYIAKKNMTEDAYDVAKQIVEHYRLDKAVLQNEWVAFVLSSVKLLSNDGAIFFVLPFEFLQVQYAEKLRTFLEARFNTIEIVTFEERVFKDIEQDICLVYLANEKEAKPYIRYRTLLSVNNPVITLDSVIMRNKPLKKWSNCILNDSETERLLSLADTYRKIGEYGDISPGIVTGSNSFFLIPYLNAKKMGIDEKQLLPVVAKSSLIPPMLVFHKKDFALLYDEKKRTHLLNLSGVGNELFSGELVQYLAAGEKEGINEGYKCRNRKTWYEVPVVETGDVCFFKRYSVLPRMLVNCDKIHTTDICYNIRLNDKIDPASFAFSFYNSLTLALCEYHGRFYGGGVGELVPSEFKRVAIPYRHIQKVDVQYLDKAFRENKRLEDIIDYVDRIVLNELDRSDVNLLQAIRKRYLRRRLHEC